MDNKTTFDRDYVVGLLEANGIDHVIEICGDIYVTGLDFNFWITADTDIGRVTLRTYWHFRQPIYELDALRCANHCNVSYIALQFSVRSAGERLAAAQVLPFDQFPGDDALIAIVKAFPIVFLAALEDSDNKGLFEPFDGEPDCPKVDYNRPHRPVVN